MADEAQDCSNQEEMPLVIRFVDNGEIREYFTKFLLCDNGLTGLALSEKIKLAVCELGARFSTARNQHSFVARLV